ncbi:HvfC family RiPP maturation protein [Microbulbifer pacificus]|uniref:DNA-binding domain-containing protein n=1 Tax=Microbulbifer pacificus TaxID=407164 RepID=A0AAU0MVV9_9GAMM|nr:putative DNA-binding domain-containing protein [Microbulbifer pacificus]WOX04807.1 putative DNA-binding domain-containing protein [Microbulbifer pacificus]
MADNTGANTDTCTSADFRETQRKFAAHLRKPDENPAPASIEDRRMGIYRDLIYNNIESFIASGFPVLRSILDDEQWHAMVRDFVHRHQSHSPYFLQISEEFLHYLQEERAQSPASADDPPFMLELAHYEWVELALDVSEEEFPAGLQRNPDRTQLLDWVPVVSPLAWSLSYQFPVHQLGADFQPQQAPPSPTFLVVYRNRADQVGFLEASAATAHLLQLAAGADTGGANTGRQLLQQLARDMQHPDPDQLLDFGAELLGKLLSLDIIAGFRPS